MRVCILVMLLCLWSAHSTVQRAEAAAAEGNSDTGDTDLDGYCTSQHRANTWSDDYCCPAGGWSLEMNPRGTGPLCTRCAIDRAPCGSDGSSGDGANSSDGSSPSCCRLGDDCLLGEFGSPRCFSSTSADGLDVSNRTTSVVSLDRPAVSSGRSSGGGGAGSSQSRTETILLYCVFAIIGCVALFLLASYAHKLQARRRTKAAWARAQMQDQEQDSCGTDSERAAPMMGFQRDSTKPVAMRSSLEAPSALLIHSSPLHSVCLRESTSLLLTSLFVLRFVSSRLVQTLCNGHFLSLS
jgi:hypothetical protein